VLEGGVQRAGDRVRINVQLIDAATDEHLWADTYDRQLTAVNIFAIQTEIATAIADALRATLSTEEQDRLATLPTENLAAYDAYLLGKQRMAKRTGTAYAEAADYFEQAIVFDPNFALAYVQLASSYLLQVGSRGLPQDEMVAKAEPLIEKALELDDRLGEAHSVLADIQFMRTDFEGAEATYQRALELNPNYADAYSGYGRLLRYVLGRPEEALTLHRKEVELDPLSARAISSVGEDLDHLGRFEEGLSWYEKSFEVDPGYSVTLWNIGVYNWLVASEFSEAIRWLTEAISADPGDPYHGAHLGRLFLDLGDPERAEYWIHRSIELGPESFVANLAMQLLHLYKGDELASLDYGRRALAIEWEWAFQVFPVQLIANHEQTAIRNC
jgi:tetratricopeptide (TPR) repeat protein